MTFLHLNCWNLKRRIHVSKQRRVCTEKVSLPRHVDNGLPKCVKYSFTHSLRHIIKFYLFIPKYLFIYITKCGIFFLNLEVRFLVIRYKGSKTAVDIPRWKPRDEWRPLTKRMYSSFIINATGSQTFSTFFSQKMTVCFHLFCI
jgi:hypothetical protein